MDTISSNLSYTSFAITVILVGFLCSSLHNGTRNQRLNMPTKRAYWYIGSLQFFKKQYSFIEEGMAWSKGSEFTFRIMDKTVVVLRGLAGRDAFFSKGLDFMGGYRLVNPQVADIMPLKSITGDESWAGFLAYFFRSEVIMQMLPLLVKDVVSHLSAFGEHGVIDPFEDLYEIVFKLAVRMSTCSELCDDPKKFKKLVRLFNTLEAGSAPTSVILPWFPTPARIGRLLAGRELYLMVSDVVKMRKRESRQEDDPLQGLIDQDLPLVEITRFVAMALFASVTNTGIALCWMIIYLQVHPEWRERIQNEVHAFIDTHHGDSSSTIAASLAEVPAENWEAETESIDLCMNETLRLTLIGTLTRINIGGDLHVSGHCLKKGTFLMYPSAELHLNPTFYPDPFKFDPTRFTPEAVTERSHYGATYLGWGGGRHICTGKRIALLMVRIITVLLMAEYDYEVVDTSSLPLLTAPEIRRNLFKAGLPKNRIFLTYRKKKVLSSRV